MVILTTQRFIFVEVPCYDMPYLQYQPSPTIYSPLFEEKILQALDRIESTNQLLHSFIQSLAEIKIQVDQSIIAISRKEEGELLSQSESNPEGQYLTRNFNIYVIFFEQSIMTLENKLVIEQFCTTKITSTDNSTKIKISREKFK